MSDSITLRGMTWDHSRGFDPMVATSKVFVESRPNVSIEWDKRSLQAFADRSIEEMVHDYDLLVIDHPHVGEVARKGNLLALDTVDSNYNLATLSNQSVGVSHQSYEIDGHQWALAIDAATPVAAYRADQIDVPPTKWDEVISLARKGVVAFALIPINALMTFMGLSRNMGFDVAIEDDQLIESEHSEYILELMKEIMGYLNQRCLESDPIGIYEWMGRSADGPHYSPFGYGYTNYSRDGYCEFPLTFWDAPGIGENGPKGTVIGGTGIAVSAVSKFPELAAEYAFWIAGAECQTGLFFDSGGQPGNSIAWENDNCNANCRNFFKNTRKTLETAWLRPRYDGYMYFQNNAGDVIHQFLKKEINLKDTQEKLQLIYLESRK